jgi:hypothetical protein
MNKSKAILDLIAELVKKKQEKELALDAQEVDLGVQELEKKQLESLVKDLQGINTTCQHRSEHRDRVIEEQERTIAQLRQYNIEGLKELERVCKENEGLKAQIPRDVS